MHCLDLSIENTWSGENCDKLGGKHYRILTHNELDLCFLALNDRANFRQIHQER